MNSKIRIKLKSYDHTLVDKSAEKIVKTVKATGAVVKGPIPLPTRKRIFTVNRSTFVNKKSREQFELSFYSCFVSAFVTELEVVVFVSVCIGYFDDFSALYALWYQ